MSLIKDLENNIVLRGKAASGNPNASAFKMASRFLSPNYVKQATTSKTEAVLKVTSFARGYKVKVLMEYVARTGKEEELTLEDEQGNLYENEKQIKDLHAQWKTDFERAADGVNEKMAEHEKRLKIWEKEGKKGKKPRTPKGAPRHATHIILSAKADNSDMNGWRTKNAARTLLEKNFGQLGYEYVFVHHEDTENPHVHVVIKNYNRELDRKLRLDKNDLFALRQDFAKELQIQGIEQSATLRQDRPNTIERISKDLESVQVKQTWYQSKIKTNKSPQIDLDNILRQQVRKIHAIEKRLPKAEISKPAKDRIKKQLRELKLEIINSKEENTNKIFISKVKALGNDAGYIKKELKQFAKIKADGKSLNPIQKKDQKKIKENIEAFADLKIKQVKEAKSTISKSKLDKKKKTKLLTDLSNLQKAVKNQIKQLNKTNKEK